MSQISSEEIVEKVREFLRLNEEYRQKELSSKEVRKWFQLKQEIEEVLFSKPPPSKEFKDERKSIRVRNLRIPVQYENGLETNEETISEISEGGLFIVTQDPLPVETSLHLTLKIPPALVKGKGLQKSEIEVHAKVVFTHVGHSFGDRAFSGMGMKFSEDMAEPTRKEWFCIVDFLLQEAMG